MSDRLGKYEIVKELGKGGMGVVYLARDTESRREVALKVLPPELTRNPKYVERFRREAKAIGHLNHSNIIQIYDIGEQEQTHYFAMEYLAGPTLRKLLELRGRLPVSEAVSIVIQIADALDAAHSQGIIHRDVKPDNIMADEAGRFKIMDFGIAHTEEGTRLTVTGTIMGTPEYMSPEQASGTAIDRRSDIYALGIVLYEILTGKAPFRAQTALEVLQMHITKMPESPRLLNPDIPGNLSNIIAKMIEKQPANRYDSFRHVINAISRALPVEARASSGAKVKEIQAPPAREKGRPAPRVREKIILQTPGIVRAALAASIILNIFLFGYALLRRGSLPEAAEPPQPVFTMGGQMFAPAALYGKFLILAGEDGAVRAVDSESGAVKWTFRAGDKVTAAPVVDGERVFIGSWDRNLYALGAEDGQLLWKTPIGGCIFSAPVLLDGMLYVCTREGHVVAIDAESGRQRWEKNTNARINYPPIAHHAAVFVATDDKKIVALRGEDGFPVGEIAVGRIKMPVFLLEHKLIYAAFDEPAGQDKLAAVTVAADVLGRGCIGQNPVWKTFVGPTSAGAR